MFFPRQVGEPRPSRPSGVLLFALLAGGGLWLIGLVKFAGGRGSNQIAFIGVFSACYLLYRATRPLRTRAQRASVGGDPQD